MFEALAEWRRSTPLRVGAVGCKIRLGLNQLERDSKVYLPLTEIANDYLDYLVVHARHAKQRSRDPPQWEAIGEVKAAARVPVIGNGDVSTAEEAEQLRAMTGCDGVMVARGAIRNPWALRRIAGAGGGEEGDAAASGTGRGDWPTEAEARLSSSLAPHSLLHSAPPRAQERSCATETWAPDISAAETVLTVHAVLTPLTLSFRRWLRRPRRTPPPRRGPGPRRSSSRSTAPTSSGSGRRAPVPAALRFVCSAAAAALTEQARTEHAAAALRGASLNPTAGLLHARVATTGGADGRHRVEGGHSQHHPPQLMADADMRQQPAAALAVPSLPTPPRRRGACWRRARRPRRRRRS